MPFNLLLIIAAILVALFLFRDVISAKLTNDQKPSINTAADVAELADKVDAANQAAVCAQAADPNEAMATLNVRPFIA